MGYKQKMALNLTFVRLRANKKTPTLSKIMWAKVTY